MVKFLPKMQELNYQADNDLIEPAVVAERFKKKITILRE